MDYWKMNVTAMLSDTDLKATAQCVPQASGREILCTDSVQITVTRNVVFGGISCESETGGPCSPCKVSANALIVTFLLENSESAIEYGVAE